MFPSLLPVELPLITGYVLEEGKVFRDVLRIYNSQLSFSILSNLIISNNKFLVYSTLRPPTTRSPHRGMTSIGEKIPRSPTKICLFSRVFQEGYPLQSLYLGIYKRPALNSTKNRGFPGVETEQCAPWTSGL